jgi:hypothetical protein
MFRLWCASLMALSVSLWAGCAAAPPESSGESPREAIAARREQPDIDAVLPLGEGWRLFRLDIQSHARVGDMPLDWKDGLPRSEPVWLKLAAPAGPFRPVQVVPGQRGFFYVVDAASWRLCLYDQDAALISTFPFPEEVTSFRGRAAVFRGADGAFTFLDYGSGEALQFADRITTDAGAARWIARGKVKLPAGLRDCVQAAGEADLLCRGAGGTPWRFDGALNRLPLRAGHRPRPEAGREPPLISFWDDEATAWVIDGWSASAGHVFTFVPARKRLREGTKPPAAGSEAGGAPGTRAPPHPSTPEKP